MGVPLLVLVPLEGGHTLEYKIKTISSKEEIVNCNRFEIDHVQWHHAITPPKACGYMGYLKGEGLYVQICTEEQDPLARCTEHPSRSHPRTISVTPMAASSTTTAS